MLQALVNKYKGSKSLINYFILTYLDKVISFALPLSVLFLIKDKTLYTFVEVAFSYATLTMIVIELGVSNYLFYGYKNAEHKDDFIKHALVNFKFLLLLYCLLAIPFFIGIRYYDDTLLVLFALVVIRTLFTLFLNFYSNIYRLKDNPSGIYVTSLLVNILSFVLLLLANYFSWSHRILYFFLPSLVLILGVCVKFIALELRLFSFKDFISFLGHSLRFAWPIILNVLAMSFINNYAKIYAYGHLSQQETVQVSYIMRIGLVIQLTHSAFSSFFSKSLFMDTRRQLNTKILKQYSFVLLFSALMVLALIFITNGLFSSQIYIPLTASTLLFLLYIILWCYIGYLEIYFGVMNANRRVLYYSIVSSLVYIILLKTFNDIGLLKLAWFMVITAVINLLLVVAGLHNLQVLKIKRIKINKNTSPNEYE